MEFHPWQSVEDFYGTIKKSIESEKATAGKKFVRFGPKARVAPEGNRLLRDQLLVEASENINGPNSGRLKMIASYEQWVKSQGPKLAEAQARPQTFGEGTYQAGFSSGDLLHPIKAVRREFESVAKAYVWDQMEQKFLTGTRPGGEPYALRYQVEEWGRVRSFLNDQIAETVLQETRRKGIPDRVARDFVRNSFKVEKLENKIKTAHELLRQPPGTFSTKQVDFVNNNPAWQSDLAFWERDLVDRVRRYGPSISRVDSSLGPNTKDLYVRYQRFLDSKVGQYDLAAARHPMSRWFAPRSGWAWQTRDFAKDPLGFAFKNYLWGAEKLPNWAKSFIGREAGLDLGERLFWSRLGELGTAYKAGLFSEAGQAALARSGVLARSGRFYSLIGRVNIRGLGFIGGIGRLLTPFLRTAVSLGSKALAKVGLTALGATLGSVVPGIGTVAGAVAATFADKILKSIVKLSLLVFGCACSCATILVAIPIAVILLIASSLGGTITSSFGNLIGAIDSAIFQPASAASFQSDLVVVASASKNQDVTAGETVTVSLFVTSYVGDVGTVSLTSTIDNNFSFGQSVNGGSALGKEISWPAFPLAKGQTKNFSYTVVAGSSMTKDTVALISSHATSGKYSGQADLYINRFGAPVGADGKHAFPVLGSNSWQCYHSPPNFNAIDIFATPGTPVVAVISGRSEARYTVLGGPVVFLYGDDGFNYYYAHLEISGRVNGQVPTGGIIGYISGNTLISRNNSSPHVHFSIDTRGIHDGPDTPAGPFLDAVGGTHKCSR